MHKHITSHIAYTYQRIGTYYIGAHCLLLTHSLGSSLSTHTHTIALAPSLLSFSFSFGVRCVVTVRSAVGYCCEPLLLWLGNMWECMHTKYVLETSEKYTMKKRLQQASIGKIQCEIDLHIHTHTHTDTHKCTNSNRHTPCEWNIPCTRNTGTPTHAHGITCTNHTQYPPTPAKPALSDTPIPTNTWHIFSFIPTLCGCCLPLSSVALTPSPIRITYGQYNSV